MSNSVVHLNPAMAEFLSFIDERRDEIENIVAYIESKDGYITSLCTGFDANMLLYAKRDLNRKLDYIVDEQYASDYDDED